MVAANVHPVASAASCCSAVYFLSPSFSPDSTVAIPSYARAYAEPVEVQLHDADDASSHCVCPNFAMDVRRAR